MKPKKIQISKIKSNPSNPRSISKEKFNKLVNSIKEFPKMLELRPLVVDENFVVLGGNMRLKALKELGIKEAPYIQEKDLTEEQKKQFIIKDNVGFGNWDYDILANEWDENILNDWGLDLWQPDEDADYSLLDAEDIDSDVENMASNVRRAIMVDFDADDYEKAYEIFKYFREKKIYTGGLILEFLEKQQKDI
tara:strand:+ start:247 stop:825 length:579 start_codon:yes stop_codon:yes gene_type:complete